MKILVFESKSYSDYDVCDVLKQMNIDYRLFSYSFNLSGEYGNEDEKFVDFFCKNIDTKEFDAVFSIDFWPPLASACYKKNIKYLAWSYDCPFHIPRVEDTMCLTNVFCFVFDKEQYKKYIDMGIENIYFMPLGVNAKRYSSICLSDEHQKFNTEVSFIGKLYDKNSYPIIRQNVNERTGILLDNIISMCQKLPGEQVLDKLLTDGIVELINAEMHSNNPKFTDVATREKIQFAIEEQLTFLERVFLLNMSGKKYKTDFYTSSDGKLLENVTCHKEVSYLNEMPYIFAASDININQTLKAIHSGVSLRVFDIVASGGFVLTNRQAELEDFFTDGIDLGVYDSIYDFSEKLDYYLTNAEKRRGIAESGRKRCLSEHSMINRLSEIFRIADVV